MVSNEELNNSSEKHRRTESILLIILITFTLSTGCARDEITKPEENPADVEAFWEEYYAPVSYENICSIDLDERGNLFAATGEFDLYYPEQVFGAENCGSRWRNLNFPYNVEPKIVRVDRMGNLYVLSSDCIYLLPAGDAEWHKIEVDAYFLEFDSLNRCFFGTAGGLFRTSDCFATQEKLLDGKISYIEFASEDAVYAATDTTMFFSDNSGDDWSQIPVPAVGNKRLWNIEVDGEEIIYIMIKDYSEWKLIGYKSNDGGESWDNILESTDFNIRRETGFLVTADNALFATYNGDLFRSFDQGESWTELFNDYRYRHHWSYTEFFSGNLMMTCATGQDLIVADENGIYRSGDNGESWLLVGLPQNEITSFLIDPEGRIFFSCRYGGFYLSEKNMDGFSPVNGGLINPEVQCLEWDGAGGILAGTFDGVFRLSINDYVWTRIGLDSTRVRKLCAPEDGRIIAVTGLSRFGCTGGVYETASGGADWSYLGMAGYNITGLRADYRGVLYAGTEYGGVFRYTGEGIVWEQLNSGLKSIMIFDITIDRGGKLYAGTRDGVFSFDDSDTVWVRSLRTEEEVIELLAAENGDIYASAGGHKLYRKQAGSDKWDILNKSSYDLTFKSLATSSDGYLYATGWRRESGGIIYRSKKSY
ncbi:MAG: hypothetical protein R6U43_09645 [Candidatus Krumholzibacteriales bacterium]